jgi:hypothetical protein
MCRRHVDENRPRVPAARERPRCDLTGLSLRPLLPGLLLPVRLERRPGRQVRADEAALKDVEWGRGLLERSAGAAGELLAVLMHCFSRDWHQLLFIGGVLTEQGKRVAMII